MTEESSTNDLSRFKTTYFEECAELLITAEECLLRLQEGSDDPEDCNAVFRCVHSIKGGAGAFAFTDLVRFAHVFETALDALRSGRVGLTPALAEVLVRGNDILGDFVRAAQEGVVLPPDHGDRVTQVLNALTGQGGADAKAAASATPAPAPESGEESFLVRFTPAANMLRTGNDPLMMVRELAGLGALDIRADLTRLPARLEDLAAQDAYLAWSFRITTEQGRQAVLDVFEFVAGDCAEVSVEAVGAETVLEPAAPPAAVAHAPAAPPPEAPAHDDHPVSLDHPADAAHPAEGGLRLRAEDKPGAGGVHTASIRVELDKVDRLVNMVGELVITQAMLGQQSNRFSAESHPELFMGLQELSHHTRELQESVMAIRAQPIKTLFSRAPRIVRDLSARLGKQVRLVMSGEGTEVDKTVIEQLSDPMVHLIRNSLDHGLETPEERAARGKPAEGTIHLSAEHRSGRVIIQIEDDGHGIDRRRVLEKAIEKGLVERGQTLSDEQIDQLIFAPGFSTAAAVSDVSGRGVGLDVVRKNIQDVGGRVSVQSQPGVGARFIMSLPLTLAVMDGMLVAVGGERYVLPLTNIVESIRPKPEQTHALVNVGNMLTLRGEYIRLVALHSLFNVEGAVTDPTKGLVVVVETEGGDRVGLLVDELLGQQQVVIKSLEYNFRPVRGVSAATILGDGRVALILDVGALKAEGDRDGGGTAPLAAE